MREFCDRSTVPYLFSAATKGASPVEAVAPFLGDLRESGLPDDAEPVPTSAGGSWPDAEAVGGWWNRRFDPEMELVGAWRA